VEYDLPVSFVAISNVQILSGMIPPEKLIDTLQPAS
jgi:hypothetical protein